MVEYELVGQLIKNWHENYISNRKFRVTLHKSMYKDILTIQKGISMLSSIEPTNNFINKLSIYSGDIIHFLYVINFFYKHTKYFLKKNKMNPNFIYCDFSSKDNFIKQCNDTVTLMLQINQKIPMKKDVSSSIKKAYHIIDTFEKHGHCLPNLSRNKNKHRIYDVLLYLKFVHTSGMKIYNMAADPVRRNIAYEYIAPSKEEEKALVFDY